MSQNYFQIANDIIRSLAKNDKVLLHFFILSLSVSHALISYTASIETIKLNSIINTPAIFQLLSIKP